MNQEYKEITNEIHDIQIKRRILNMQERLLHKKIQMIEKNMIN